MVKTDSAGALPMSASWDLGSFLKGLEKNLPSFSIHEIQGPDEDGDYGLYLKAKPIDIMSEEAKKITEKEIFSTWVRFDEKREFLSFLMDVATGMTPDKYGLMLDLVNAQNASGFSFSKLSCITREGQLCLRVALYIPLPAQDLKPSEITVFSKVVGEMLSCMVIESNQLTEEICTEIAATKIH